MKILTKEEEAEHYNATVKGGSIGGLVGLTLGGAALYVANARFHTIRSLTIPMKSFLVSSSGTFAAIISADRASRSYEWNRDPSRNYKDQSSLLIEQEKANETTAQRLKSWGKSNRYSIVTASWVASMGIAFGIVSRNKFLTGAQKLVQARVYAQGLTLAVLVASAAFEMGDAKKGTGRWETVMVLDPNDPEHKHLIQKKIHHEIYEGEDLWRDMVAAEERRINERKRAAEERNHSSGKISKGKENKDKISSEMMSAGKVAFADAKEREEKNQVEQAEKDADAKNESAQSGLQVKSRNEI
ncbi:Replication factor C, subunit RFC4 [Ciborinia camelliae]|nr:Replication factor C, subunit RFC4 [Ciborinia camelliae]